MTTSEAAFIFADLVGYTELTEQRGDEAAADTALAFCEEVCELNRGHGAEDVKLIGDASLIYSPDAARAVDLSLHIIERIGPASGLPKVRVGVDWGPAAQREDDWFGTTVNTASRLVSLADEGQALVTGRLREAASEIPGVEFVDQGSRHLRGLREEVRTYALERVAGVDAAHAHLGLEETNS